MLYLSIFHSVIMMNIIVVFVIGHVKHPGYPIVFITNPIYIIPLITLI